MSPSARIRVKISSDSVESIDITRVLARDLSVVELCEMIAGTAGLDPDRMAQHLRRGSYVAGLTRYRWEPLTVDPGAAALIIEHLPKPEPSRPFVAERCESALLTGPAVSMTVTPDEPRRRWFKKIRLWDILMELAQAARYLEYSYRHRGDVYRLMIEREAGRRLTEASRMIRYSTLEKHLQADAFEWIDFLTRR